MSLLPEIFFFFFFCLPCTDHHVPDSLAQAKTGTGKTLAFLLPVLHNMLKDPAFTRRGASASDIGAIIISPTRELAEQIATEAKRLAGGSGIQVQTAVGGTQKSLHLKLMRQYGCHLLVGTPGRLLDLLSDNYSGVKAPKLGTFILDEADRLLDEGFSDAILEIQEHLPDPKEVDRQTLLFSATVPQDVMFMVNQIMKPDYKYIKTVRDDEVPTHLSVPQRVVSLRGFENTLPAILQLVKNYLEQDHERPFKAIVYFNSTKEVELAYEVFRGLLNEPGALRSGHPLGRMSLYELHSRLTQARRSHYAAKFRADRSAILFSSDVTARGMDFPEVTHVIQAGIARDRPSYIHRLGRTGRANKSGEGWTFIHNQESKVFNERLHSLPIESDRSLDTAFVDMSDEMADVSPEAKETLAQVKDSMENVSESLKADAYRAQMGSLVGTFGNTSAMIENMRHMAKHGYHLSRIPETPDFIRRAGASPKNRFRTRARTFHNHERDAMSSFRNSRGGRGSRPQRSGRW